MRHRILLAEESETIRSVAESLVRQGGYELISVSEGAKVLEILEFTRPDLMIVASDLKGKGNKPVYEYIQENPRIADIPMFILCNADEAGLPFREEIILPKPFEPKDFLAKINQLIQSGQPVVATQVKQSESNPLSTAELNDDVLDAALGLDQIEVTGSEDMNHTKTMVKKGSSDKSEKMIGLDHNINDTDHPIESGKVESLMIREDKEEIAPHDTGKHKIQQKMSNTGKLEILDDQYGLVDPSKLNSGNDNPDHDYSWFLNELQKDTDELSHPKSEPSTNLNESQKLNFSNTAESLEPSTSVKASKPNSSGGVDKFIDEFKKEVEKIHSDGPESITVDESSKNNNPEIMVWQDTIEQLNPETIQLFTKQLVTELAEKLADKIAGKIDSDKLLAMIKTEIVNKLKK